MGCYFISRKTNIKKTHKQAKKDKFFRGNEQMQVGWQLRGVSLLDCVRLVFWDPTSLKNIEIMGLNLEIDIEIPQSRKFNLNFFRPNLNIVVERISRIVHEIAN